MKWTYDFDNNRILTEVVVIIKSELNIFRTVLLSEYEKKRQRYARLKDKCNERKSDRSLLHHTQKTKQELDLYTHLCSRFDSKS